MKPLSSYVSSVRQRAAALFHRSDQLKSDSTERRQAWNRVIAEHQKPLEPAAESGKITLTQP
jgi:hypothetical protein